MLSSTFRRPRTAGLACVVLGLAVASLHAQPSPLRPSPTPFTDIQIRVFGVEDGLPSRGASQLSQTADGHLYVSTNRGLYRFNGHAFESFRIEGIHSQMLVVQHHDRQDRLWFRTARNEIAVLSKGRSTVLPGLPAPARDFVETSDGTLWLTGSQGLMRITGDSSFTVTRFTRRDGLPSDTVNAIVDLANGTRVVVTHEGIVVLQPDAAASGGVRIVRPALDPLGFGTPNIGMYADHRALWIHHPERPRTVTRYRAGRIEHVASTVAWGGITVDSITWTPRSRWLPPIRLRDAIPRWMWTSSLDGILDQSLGYGLQARDGTRWLLTQAGAAQYPELVRIRAGEAERIPLHDHLQFRSVIDMLEDHEGSLWALTDQGVLQVVSGRVASVTTSHGLTSSFTTAVMQARDGFVWIGTWGGGLFRFGDGRLEAHFDTRAGLPNDEVRALFEASDGSIWVGMYKHYARIAGGRIIDAGRRGGEIRAFVERKDGTVWMGGASTLSVWRAGTLSEIRPDVWGDHQIWTMHEARDGMLWIGTDRGLYRMHGDSIVRESAASGGPRGLVSMIREDDDGTLWFGTYEDGVFRYRDGQFAAITTEHGLHDNGIWAMVDDGHGGTWMPSDRGICRVDHVQLHAVLDDTTGRTRLACTLFTESEGVPSRESNRAFPAGWRLQDGRLLFNSQSGAVLIRAARTQKRAPVRNTIIEAVHADGVRITSTGAARAVIPPGTRQIAIDFATLSFLAPRQTRYQYRLEGYDRNWVNGGPGQRRASYTNLAPGNYVFRVTGTGGVLSDFASSEATIPVTVKPTLAQHPLFRSLLFLTVVLLLIAAYRIRMARLLELNRVRARIASDLHDDLGADLGAISLIVEMLQGESRLSGSPARHLSRIRETVDEMNASLRDTIWVVDPQHCDVEHLLRRIQEIAARQLPGVEMHMTGGDMVENRRLGMVFMRHVLLIYKEVLHNVARHARARCLDVHVETTDRRLVLSVHDDGEGFGEARVTMGYGLASLRRRAGELGGSIDIISAPGHGTRITLSVPMA